MNGKLPIIIGCLLLGLLYLPASGQAAEDVTDPPGPAFRLVRAVMCETIEGYEPRHIAVAFSVAIGRISCKEIELLEYRQALVKYGLEVGVDFFLLQELTHSVKA